MQVVRVSATEARKRFSELLNMVQYGNTLVEIERQGKKVATLGDYDQANQPPHPAEAEPANDLMALAGSISDPEAADLSSDPQKYIQQMYREEAA